MPTTLVFERDNPKNTTLVDEHGTVVYTVATESGLQKSVTRVHDAHGRRVAEWVWRDMLRDSLTLGDGRPMAASSWLKKTWIPFKK